MRKKSRMLSLMPSASARWCHSQPGASYTLPKRPPECQQGESGVALTTCTAGIVNDSRWIAWCTGGWHGQRCYLYFIPACTEKFEVE
eukprot:3625971-Amphidinium_carterae.1